MNLSEIKRYIKLYIVFLRQSFIWEMSSRFSYLMGLFVEFGYQITLLFFFQVVYGNVKEIAGWNYYEILFLTGLTTLTSETILPMVYILNFARLPQMIKDGDIDQVLTKPINSLFFLSLSRPYTSGLVASLSGWGLIYYSLNHLNIALSISNVFSGIMIFICGWIMMYSIFVIFSSLSFKFIGSSQLPNLALSIIVFFKEKPHDIYQGILKIIFYFVFPIVFACSIPAKAVLHGIDFRIFILAIFISILFLTIALKLWNTMIKHYSSASS